MKLHCLPGSVSKMLLAAALVCPATAAIAADVVIALSAPTTGTDAPLADPVVKGYKLAIKMANKEPGLPGKILESVQDDQDKPEVGATVARKLCGQDNVVGVVGNFASSINLASGPVYEDCMLSRVSATASNNTLTSKGWKYFFRICSKNSDQIGQGMQWVAANWPEAKAAAIITGNDASGREVAAHVTQLWKERGGKVLSQVQSTPGTSDFRGILTSMLADKPDFIFVGMFDTDSGLFVKQARELGYRGRFFGTDAIASTNFISVGGAKSTDGVFMTNLGFDPTKIASAAAFVAAYQAEYKEAPPSYAANAFDATMVLVQAWKAAGGAADRKAVRDALASKTFGTLFGPLAFNAVGDVAMPRIGIYKVSAGKIEFAAQSETK